MVMNEKKLQGMAVSDATVKAFMANPWLTLSLKTALVEALLAGIDEGGPLRVGHGQCVEQHGAGEPYLPVLEALGRLGRGVGRERLVQILRQQAPTWLAQLPGLWRMTRWRRYSGARRAPRESECCGSWWRRSRR